MSANHEEQMRLQHSSHREPTFEQRIQQALRKARAEGFRLCQEMAAAAIIDASDMNGQIYVMRAAAKVRALKVEGEAP